MIKTIVPKEQTFQSLADNQFFMKEGIENFLYYKILDVDGRNAIMLEEIGTGQRSNRYDFKLVTIENECLITRVEPVKIEVLISAFVK